MAKPEGPTGIGKGMSPAEVAAWSALIGGVAGGAQGALLYENPKLIAAKALLGAGTTAGVGYGLARLRPWLQANFPYAGVLPTLAKNAHAYAEGYFETLEDLGS